MNFSTDPAAAWAASGAMSLTGRRDGPPQMAPGDPAGVAQRYLKSLGLSRPNVLSERAAQFKVTRNWPWSPGGSMRILRAADGWLALSLPRQADRESVPALICGEVSRGLWPALEAWSLGTRVCEAEERLRLLGLPGGGVPDSPPTDRPPVIAATSSLRPTRSRPLVVNLSSLWAGPLAAHLIHLRGAEVIKVESTSRPDGLRSGAPAMFDNLHRGQRRVEIDLRQDQQRLIELIHRADLVIESSRPRALEQLGIVASDFVSAGTSWLSITARGRQSNAVGFGDDVAATAGMVLEDGGQYFPVGDAIADPLTGLAAAAAAAACLDSGATQLIDVSMLHVVAQAVGPVSDHEVVRSGQAWWVDSAVGRTRVAEASP